MYKQMQKQQQTMQQQPQLQQKQKKEQEEQEEQKEQKQIFYTHDDPYLQDYSWQILNEQIDTSVQIRIFSSDPKQIRLRNSGKKSQSRVFKYILPEYMEQDLSDFRYDKNQNILPINKQLHPLGINRRLVNLTQNSNFPYTMVNIRDKIGFTFHLPDTQSIPGWTIIKEKYTFYDNWKPNHQNVYVEGSAVQAGHIYQNPLKRLILNNLPHHSWKLTSADCLQQTDCSIYVFEEPILPWKNSQNELQMEMLGVNNSASTYQLTYLKNFLHGVKQFILSDIIVTQKQQMGDSLTIATRSGEIMGRDYQQVDIIPQLCPYVIPNIQYLGLTDTKGFDDKQLMMFQHISLKGMLIGSNFKENSEKMAKLQSACKCRLLIINDIGPDDVTKFGQNSHVEILILIKKHPGDKNSKKIFSEQYLLNFQNMKLLITNNENLSFNKIPVIYQKRLDQYMNAGIDYQKYPVIYWNSIFELMDQHLDDPYSLHQLVCGTDNVQIQMFRSEFPNNQQNCIKTTKKYLEKMQKEQQQKLEYEQEEDEDDQIEANQNQRQIVSKKKKF